MYYILVKWFITALALILVSEIVPGIEIGSLYIALIVALIWGFFNAIVRPVLIFLTLPITVLSLGLFVLVINGFLFWFISSFISDFHVVGFASAFIGALLMSVVGFLTNRFIERDKKRAKEGKIFDLK